MDNTAAGALKAEVRNRTDEARQHAKAPQSCVERGNAILAVRILIDFDGLAHDSQDLSKHH
jgi:hypothetical protein